MRKIFLDCGVREGDGIAAFLGDDKVGTVLTPGACSPGMIRLNMSL